jgi:uncharacterized protein involved in exopolysaccharide biosynthesis
MKIVRPAILPKDRVPPNPVHAAAVGGGGGLMLGLLLVAYASFYRSTDKDRTRTDQRPSARTDN